MQDNQFVIELIQKVLIQQEESDKRQQESDKRQQKYYLQLQENYVEIKVRLEKIEKNTVTIMGAVISDFAGITPSTKADLEQAGAEIAEIPEEEIHQYATDTAVRKELNTTYLGRVKGKRGGGYKKPVVSVSRYAKEYDPSMSRGDLTALGNWVGNILNKIKPNTLFGGKYHPRLENLIRVLVGYYVVERETVSVRKY